MSAQGPPHPPTVPQVSSQPKTVLIVDDELQLRTLTALVLQRAGYEVLAAADAESALAIVRNGEKPIHLLLTDIEMPGQNGIELSGRIATERPDIRVLVCSGNPNYSNQTEFPFLAKPYSPSELYSAVADALAQPHIEPMEIPAPATPSAVREWRWTRAHEYPLVWAAAALVLVCFSFSLYRLRGKADIRPRVVNLQAMRGAVAHAEVSGPLLLNLELYPIARHNSYQVELVDGLGRVIWRRAVVPKGGGIQVATAPLPPGIYFVRLYALGEELLREYELLIDEAR